jgi:hypothetical protein
VAAVAVNAPRWLGFYEALIETRAPFPPPLDAADAPAEPIMRPAGFPPPGHATHSATITTTGPGPSSPPAPVEVLPLDLPSPSREAL